MASDKKEMKADIVAPLETAGMLSPPCRLTELIRPDRMPLAVPSVPVWHSLCGGSINVIGLPVKAEGKQFYVRGIFEEEEPRLFLQAQAESKEPYPICS